MESEQDKYKFNIILYILDYADENKCKSIKLKTLQSSKIEIKDKKIIIPIELDKNNNLKGEYQETVFLYGNNEKLLKEFLISLSCGIDNLFCICLNEDNGTVIQIEAMWDIGNIEEAKNEREIKDIEYNGEKIKFFEKLFERKRWNFININIELLQKDIFSEKTLNYIRNNRDISYKYDILINREGIKGLLKQSIEKKQAKLLTCKEKNVFKNQLENFYKEIENETRVNEKNEKNSFIKLDKYCQFLIKNNKRFNELESIFKIYNNRWDFNNFDKEDFILFEKFSRIMLFYTPKVFTSFGYLKIIVPEYDKLLNRLKSNKNLNFIECSRIISGFAKFCANILKSDIPPKLIIFEELKNENPYKIAVEKYKKIIEDLEESSCFFKKLLIYDSGANNIINEWDFEDYNVKRMMNSEDYDNCYFEITKFQDFKYNFKKK